MNSKLLFFDIDGTLAAEPSGIVPESTGRAISRARENGHQVFVNTGRTFCSISREIFNMNFDGYVCGCGTHIYYKGKKLLESAIPHDLCVKVVEFLRRRSVPVFYEADKAVFFDQTYPNPWTQEAMGMFGTRGRDIGDLLEDETLTYDKFLVFLKGVEQAEEISKFLEEFFYCISRGDGVWEVTQKGYTKATGIDFMCRYLNADKEDCFAIGDSENDLDMMRAVPNSIAMGNAKEEILPYCSFVTKNLEDDGIEYALRHFGMIDD